MAMVNSVKESGTVMVTYEGFEEEDEVKKHFTQSQSLSLSIDTFALTDDDGICVQCSFF